MGGTSSKRTFFWQRKKKSPLNKAWSRLKRVLPSKKRKKKKKSVLEKLNLDNLRKEQHSQKRFSLPTDKKEPLSLKRFSLGNTRRESIQDGGGLRRFSLPPSRKDCKKMKPID